MEIRPYTSSEYPLICSWWQARDWPIISPECLPKHGILVGNYCAGFVYTTDSSLAWIEWIVSNPATDSKERNQAMDILIDSLIGKCRLLGARYIFTSVSHEKLQDRYVKHGFNVTESQVTHMIRSL